MIKETGKPTPVDEYIFRFPQELQVIFQQVRSTVQKAAPNAEEIIS